MKNNLKGKLFYFLLGVLVTIASTAFAYSYFADQIVFTSSDSEWDVDNASDAIDHLHEVTSRCEFGCPNVGDVVYENSSTGTIQRYRTSCSGLFKLEVWGAQGGDSGCASKPGGFGGYSVGIAELDAKTDLYIGVGGKGITADKVSRYVDGGFNGGGRGRYSDGLGSIGECTGSGGGATHIALDNGLLKDLSSHAQDGRILIVAGGGGGSAYYNNSNSYVCYGSGGHAGGFNGGDAYNYSSGRCGQPSPRGGYGGLQTLDTRTGSYMNFGTFGQGGWMDHYGEAGGGGGYYGGSSSGAQGAGGGSGYIGSFYLKVNTLESITSKMFCYDCTENDALGLYTVSSHGTTAHEDDRNPECSAGYSAVAVSKCAKAGDGYVKITYLG